MPHVACLFYMKKLLYMYYMTIIRPAHWCHTSGAGPAAPPAPAMKSPARASTRISLKQRSSAKQGLEPAMWWRTPALLTNSQLLESWPIWVHLTQAKRVTPPAAHWTGRIGRGPAPGTGLVAIWATAASNRVLAMHHIALCGKCCSSSNCVAPEPY
jgi:hypothetical protein